MFPHPSPSPLQTCRRYTKQICYAIEFLHGTGVIHRDIKGDNILLTGDGIVKLADFGCSKALLSLQAGTHGVTAKTMVGTPHWMAPEVIKNQDQGYSFTADIWSIGCTVVEMLTGKPPWPEFSSMWGAVFHIANSTGPPDNVPSDIPAATKEFLEHCFERDTSLRFSSTQLLKVRVVCTPHAPLSFCSSLCVLRPSPPPPTTSHRRRGCRCSKHTRKKNKKNTTPHLPTFTSSPYIIPAVPFKTRHTQKIVCLFLILLFSSFSTAACFLSPPPPPPVPFLTAQHLMCS